MQPDSTMKSAQACENTSIRPSPATSPGPKAVGYVCATDLDGIETKTVSPKSP